MAQKYDDDSIKVLKGLEGVRKRPAMYIGDTSVKGFHHLVWEILDNANDEAVSGEAKKIGLTFHVDGSVTVSDDGRGMPVNEHSTEKIPTIDVIFTILHAGGKFNNTDENSAFKTSSGTHGVGASVVNALSTKLFVNVKREGKEVRREYKNGEPTEKKLEVLQRGLSRKETGTTVRFYPDKKIFKDVEGFDKDTIVKRLEELSYLNAGVEYTLTWEIQGGEPEVKVFKSERGLQEYLEHLTKNKKLTHKPIYVKGENIGGCAVELVFCYEEKYDTSLHSFANNVCTHDHGVHMNAALDSIVKVVSSIADSAGLLKNLNLTLCKSDAQEGLSLIISVMVPEPQYEGQTKGKLNNEEIRKPIGDWLIEVLTKELKKDKDAAKVISNKIVDTMKANDAAKKVKKLQKSGAGNSLLAGKLSDCLSKDSDRTELYIVEGDSAGGTAKDSRDRRFQAVLPLKGKILNVSKSTLNAALENKEIASIVSALGVKIQHSECSLENLRYNKIIISTDADSDGLHICCLLFSLFYKFMRKLIEEGHLYVCDLPLFRVAMSNKIYYLKDDKALEEFKKKHGNKKMEISRFKGLGEMDVESFSELAMKQETRHLKQITIKDTEKADEMLEKLMGEGAAGRKEYLMTHLNFKDI